jgi:hypothetical protein
MLALAADVQFIQQVMSEVEVLQHSLEKETSEISPQSIELKSTVKKILTRYASPVTRSAFLLCTRFRMLILYFPVTAVHSLARAWIGWKFKVRQCGD